MIDLPAVQEYQDVLKAAALTFLERHQCEHLACSDMNAIRDRQRLDIVSSTSTHTVIIDPTTGNAWAIPVSLIYERIINAPDNGRFRVAAP